MFVDSYLFLERGREEERMGEGERAEERSSEERREETGGGQRGRCRESQADSVQRRARYRP